jgi:hypothetical protein
MFVVEDEEREREKVKRSASGCLAPRLILSCAETSCAELGDGTMGELLPTSLRCLRGLWCVLHSWTQDLQPFESSS